MDSLNIVDQLKKKINFLSANGDEYKFNVTIENLVDMKYQFSVYVEGKLNDLHRELINQAIVYTWNMTAYQTKDFIDYYSKNYVFTFVPNTRLEVDIDGKLQTRLIYFISSMGNYASEEDFDLLPKQIWLQDSMVKFDLPYSLLEGQDSSTKEYNKLYYIDFDGYVDPSFEGQISDIILEKFRNIYTGN